MHDLKFAIRQLLKNPGFAAVAMATLTLAVMGGRPACAHPGSGIVVDRQGRVYFSDTGQGVWMIDEQGQVSRHEGPAFHWMAIDQDNRLGKTPGSSFVEPSTDIRKVGSNPTLLLSSDFPLTVDHNGALCYPELGQDRLLRVYRLASLGEQTVLATLRATTDGQPLQWLNGVPAGPDGSIYFSENTAVRPINPRGDISTKAGEEINIEGIRFCWCPPGTFRMGSPANEPGHRADESPVEVTLTKGFWMGKHEVTQGQWQRVMGALPSPLNAGVGENFPVYWVTYIDAEEFCHKLTAQARDAGALPDGWEFRLPTEAQWEYACRAGTATAFAFGATLTDRQANIGKPYNGTPTGVPGSAAAPVGSYPANAWGLHDMHGNEFEWCRDWYHAQLPGGIDPDLSETKGQPNRDGSYSRVRRGGAWMDAPEFCRSALRLRYEPERHADHIGFRVTLCPSIRTTFDP